MELSGRSKAAFKFVVLVFLSCTLCAGVSLDASACDLTNLSRFRFYVGQPSTALGTGDGFDSSGSFVFTDTNGVSTPTFTFVSNPNSAGFVTPSGLLAGYFTVRYVSPTCTSNPLTVALSTIPAIPPFTLGLPKPTNSYAPWGVPWGMRPWGQAWISPWGDTLDDEFLFDEYSTFLPPLPFGKKPSIGTNPSFFGYLGYLGPEDYPGYLGHNGLWMGPAPALGRWDHPRLPGIRGRVFPHTCPNGSSPTDPLKFLVSVPDSVLSWDKPAPQGLFDPGENWPVDESCQPTVDPDVQWTPPTVNTSTGDLILPINVFPISSPGAVVPAQPIRILINSEGRYDGSVGGNSILNYDMKALFNGSTAKVTGDDGQIRTFACLPTGCTETGGFATLKKNSDGTSTLTEKTQVIYTFNIQGSLISKFDPRSQPVTIDRNAQNQIEDIRINFTKIEVNYSPSNGKISGFTDLDGNTVNLDYDSIGCLKSVTGAVAQSHSLVNDFNCDPISDTDGNGNTINFTFNLNGQVLSFADAYNKITTLSYQGPNTVVTKPQGNSWTFTSNSNFQWLSESDPLGDTVSVVRGSNNIPVTLTTANGAVWGITSDGKGNVLKVTDPQNNPIIRTYDANNDPLSMMNQGGFTWACVVGVNHLPSGCQNPLSGTRAYMYDSEGRLIQFTNENGIVTIYEYDDVNHTVTVTQASGTPNAYTTIITYDPAGRVIQVQTPVRTDVHTWDAAGYLLSVTQAVGAPEARTWTYTWDSNHKLTLSTNFRGVLTKTIYDADNRPIEADEAAGLPEQGTIKYVYNDNGTVKIKIDVLGNPITLTYDAADRPISLTDVVGNTTLRVYDANGNLIKETDPAGDVITYVYDAFNRKIVAQSADGTINNTYAFDVVGNLVKMTDTTGTSSFVWNGLNQPITYTDSSNNSLGYSYDPVGNRIGLNLPGGIQQAFTFNSLNDPVSANDGKGTTSFLRDLGRRPIQIKYPNGTAAFRTYNSIDEPVTIMNFKGTTEISGISNEYDPNGNLTKSTTASGGMTILLWDGRDWMKSHTAANGSLTSETYDAAGNRLQQTTPSGTTIYTFNSLGGLIGDGKNTYVNDNNGNVTNDGTFKYTYDAWKQLINVKSLNLGTVNSQYKYNGLGLRVSEITPSGTLLFLVDPFSENTVWRMGVGGTVSNLFVGPTALSEINSTTGLSLYLTYDALHNVMTVTNGSGATAGNYTFTPFGVSTSVLDPLGNNEPYKAFGLEKDLGTPFYYSPPEGYYNPTLGRWIGQTPFQPNFYLQLKYPVIR
jgi:YD repeat-containing protein